MKILSFVLLVVYSAKVDEVLADSTHSNMMILIVKQVFHFRDSNCLESSCNRSEPLKRVVRAFWRFSVGTQYPKHAEGTLSGIRGATGSIKGSYYQLSKCSMSEFRVQLNPNQSKSIQVNTANFYTPRVCVI